MKKLLIGVCLMAVSLAHASVDNVTIAFATPGPDKYADGSTVLDGEKYALVWTPTGSTFAGVAADGTAVAPSRVALKAVAQGGRCPDVLFQIDETYAAANYPNGSWTVVMLDTRKFAVDPVTKVIDRTQVASVGGDVVNGYVAATVPTVSRTAASVAPAGIVTAGDTRAVPEGGENLTITGIALEDDLVKITAKGALPSMTYALKAGDKVGELKADADAGERYGEADGTVTIYTPKKDGAQFYGVSGR